MNRNRSGLFGCCGASKDGRPRASRPEPVAAVDEAASSKPEAAAGKLTASPASVKPDLTRVLGGQLREAASPPTPASAASASSLAAPARPAPVQVINLMGRSAMAYHARRAGLITPAVTGYGRADLNLRLSQLCAEHTVTCPSAPIVFCNGGLLKPADDLPHAIEKRLAETPTVQKCDPLREHALTVGAKDALAKAILSVLQKACKWRRGFERDDGRYLAVEGIIIPTFQPMTAGHDWDHMQVDMVLVTRDAGGRERCVHVKDGQMLFHATATSGADMEVKIAFMGDTTGTGRLVSDYTSSLPFDDTCPEAFMELVEVAGRRRDILSATAALTVTCAAEAEAESGADWTAAGSAAAKPAADSMAAAESPLAAASFTASA